MTVKTNALSQLLISVGAPATNDAAGFGAKSYTKLGEVVNFGEAGATFADVTHSPVESRTVQSFKGSVDYGTRAVALGKDIADAGQIILKAASDGAQVDTIHSLKLLETDGTIEFVQVRVMAFTRNHGTIDQIIGANVTFRLLAEIIDA